MSRPAALLLALGLLLACSRSHAWTLGQYRFADGTRLVLEQEPGVLRARVAGSAAPAWQFGVDAQTARLHGAAAPGSAAGGCAGRLWVTPEPRDLDGNGSIDAARGERLRLHVLALPGAPGAAPVLTALELRGTEARVVWTRVFEDPRTTGVALAAPALATLHPEARQGASLPAPLTTRTRAILLLGSGWPRDEHADARHTRGNVLGFDAATGLPVALADADFDASLPGGIATVDLDGDGATDRLYLTDAAARLWRADVRGTTGGATLRWWLLADLSGDLEADHFFEYAPDVTLLRHSPDGTSLAITTGTSDRAPRSAGTHWLFQVHDSRAGAPPPPVLAAALPLRDAPPSGATGSDAAGFAQHSGFRLRLPGPLAAAPLTIAGHLLVATATAGAATPSPRACAGPMMAREPLTVTRVDATPLREHAATAAVTVHEARGAPLQAGWLEGSTEAAGPLTCTLGDTTLGDTRLALCPTVPRLERNYWLRRDAP
jgi:hypothetical protein